MAEWVDRAVGGGGVGGGEMSGFWAGYFTAAALIAVLALIYIVATDWGRR